MTTVKTPIFIDTNVLIRLYVATAPQHADVRKAITQLILNNALLWVSRQVLREYAAVFTRPQTYTLPVPTGAIATQIRMIEARFQVADETALVTDQLCSLLETVALGGKQVHDANVVATMQIYGITRLFTLNPIDFTRFSNVITVLTLEDVLKDSRE